MKAFLYEITVFLLFIMFFETTSSKNLNEYNENLILSIKDPKVLLT